MLVVARVHAPPHRAHLVRGRGRVRVRIRVRVRVRIEFRLRVGRHLAE